MNCLIVDDNPMARLALRNLISEIDYIELDGEYDNAMDAYNHLQNSSCDLIFLDIEMPGMNGLELIQSLDKQPQIIIISSKTEYAVQGFDLEVADYLVKPVKLPRLLKAVQKAAHSSAGNDAKGSSQSDTEQIFVRIENQLQRLDFQDILFVQALGDYVVFQTAEKKYPVHLTMKAVEEKLPSETFIRVHRSYIIAIDKIENLEQNSLLIAGHIIPVSDSNKKKLLSKLNIV